MVYANSPLFSSYFLSFTFNVGLLAMSLSSYLFDSVASADEFLYEVMLKIFRKPSKVVSRFKKNGRCDITTRKKIYLG